MTTPTGPASGAPTRRTSTSRRRPSASASSLQDRWWTPIEQITVMPGPARRLRHLVRPQRPPGDRAVRPGPPAGHHRQPHPGRAQRRCSPTTAAPPRRLTLLVASGIDAVEAGRTVEYQWSNTTRDFTNKISRERRHGRRRDRQKAKTAPHADELTGGFRREIFPNTVASVEYTYRKFSNIWAATEINRIWDPTGSRVVGWKDPTKAGRDVSLYSTPDGNYRKYHGITLSSEGAALAATGSTAPATTCRGPTAPARASWAPTLRQPPPAPLLRGLPPRGPAALPAALRGELHHPLHQPGRLFHLHHRGARDQGLSTTPSTAPTSTAGRPSARRPTAPNDIESIGELRFPDQVNLDLTLRINVSPSPRFGSLNLVVDVFNVLNLRTATSFRTTDLRQLRAGAAPAAPPCGSSSRSTTRIERGGPGSAARSPGRRRRGRSPGPRRRPARPGGGGTRPRSGPGLPCWRRARPPATGPARPARAGSWSAKGSSWSRRLTLNSRRRCSAGA